MGQKVSFLAISEHFWGFFDPFKAPGTQSEFLKNLKINDEREYSTRRKNISNTTLSGLKWLIHRKAHQVVTPCKISEKYNV